VFHDSVIDCADTPGLSVTVFCATVTLVPLPLLTSIVTVTLTGMAPVLLTVNVMSTLLPAVVEMVDRLAAPNWIDGSGETTVNVMLTR
jgi:threonine/homoserine efflux transporter RhtA